MSDARRKQDWTQGEPAIVYQRCVSCGAVQYFRRTFCSACGAPDPADMTASGSGTVHSAALVTRAATPETRAHAPYKIVLVDMLEDFRMMAHGDRDLAIGDAVAVRFEQFTGRIVPVFRKSG
ncbi:MAG TPA: OB-fold domain-containing protein [Nitrobacter sp.]|jgi:uncharacterized OB-fold protein|nr:OB-fold domain-containing protein [Nitrobacter sp.]